MITPTDISNILYKDCENFGIDIIPDGKTIAEESRLGKECIVIHSKKQQVGKYWKKSYVEINICIPDLSPNEANSIRLNELERKANDIFSDSVGRYDGSYYNYSIESIGKETDSNLKCHYVNVRILFNVLNV